MLNLNILLIDDETEICTLLGDQLTLLGCKVNTASGADIALELLKTHKYDLLITDIIMPCLTGDKILNKAKEAGYLQNTKIIVITGGIALNRTKAQKELVEKIADAFLEKPFSTMELKNAIMKVFSI